MSKEKILTIDDLPPMHKDTYFFGYGIDIENPDEMARQIIKLKEENYRLKSEVESLTEFKEEHDIMKHFIISNKLWEKFLNFDEFIKWLRK